MNPYDTAPAGDTLAGSASPRRDTLSSDDNGSRRRSPAELETLIERRQRAGADRLDETWEGVLHKTPAPSGEHAIIAQQLAVVLDGPARAAGLHATMHELNVGENEYDYRVPDGGLHRTAPHPSACGTQPSP